MPEFIHYTLILSLGYLLGSFPTAYLLVRWTARLDIRESGSGNVGAMNTFDVTSSKLLGLFVMVIDIVKGIVAVETASLLFDGGFWMMGVAGIGAILGHNYSPWIRLKGGRGLATGAGVMLVLAWIVVVIWCAAWGINYSYSRNVHISNVVASVATPFIVWLTPEKVLHLVLRPSMSSMNLVFLASIVFSLILIRHARSIAEFWKPSHKA